MKLFGEDVLSLGDDHLRLLAPDAMLGARMHVLGKLGRDRLGRCSLAARSVGALVLFESSDPAGAWSPEAGGAVVLFAGVRRKCLRTAPRETPRASAIRRSE